MAQAISRLYFPSQTMISFATGNFQSHFGNSASMWRAAHAVDKGVMSISVHAPQLMGDSIRTVVYKRQKKSLCFKSRNKKNNPSPNNNGAKIGASFTAVGYFSLLSRSV